MTTLENLWYGNINPTMEIDTEESKRLTALVARAQEELLQTLTDEQRKLFEKYASNCEEHSMLVNSSAFIIGFKLAMKIMMEVGLNE